MPTPANRTHVPRMTDELEKLRALVIAWCDADTEPYCLYEGDCGCWQPYCVAVRNLRKAVQR